MGGVALVYFFYCYASFNHLIVVCPLLFLIKRSASLISNFTLTPIILPPIIHQYKCLLKWGQVQSDLIDFIKHSHGNWYILQYELG